MRKAQPGFFEKLVEASGPVINLATESGNVRDNAPEFYRISETNMSRVVKTALHWACTFATANEVSVLLKHGADPSIKNVRNV